MSSILFFGCAAFQKNKPVQKQNPVIKSTTLFPQNKTVQSDDGDVQDQLSDDDNDNNIDYLPLVKDGDEENTKCGQSADEEDSAITVKGQSILDEALDFYQASQEFWQKGEIDNALHALDQAYSSIIEVESYDIPKLNQQKDDLRFMISKRILEIYASRHTTAKGNHNAIPLVINKDVQKEIDLMTTGENRKFFIASYIRSGKYRPYIVEQLKKAGLPEELSWLPLIESGYKVRAFSKARALGLWQFIPSTGYKYGLKRNHHTDERLDPYKSTLAAIDYLKELHDIFGDWMTVLAGYNCGENRVLAIIREQNVNYLDDFWDLYQRLPCETRRYVPQFLATLQIVKHLNKYFPDNLDPDPPLKFDTVTVSKQMYLKNVAAAIHVTEDQLTDLNPELRHKLLPPDEYTLRVPVGTKELLLANLDKIPQYTKPVQEIAYHRVRRGETLSGIASRYHTTVNNIAYINRINKKKYIRIGMILKIPHSGQNFEPSGERKIITYKVRAGDSLYTLAKRFGTTVNRIQEMNNLKSSMLQIDQKLTIATGQSNSWDIYRVKNGDSPFTIAKKHNMNLDYFLRINNLSKNSKIYPGQKLFVE